MPGFIAHQVRATGPILLLSEQPGSTVLTRVTAEVFSHISQLGRGRELNRRLLSPL